MANKILDRNTFMMKLGIFIDEQGATSVESFGTRPHCISPILIPCNIVNLPRFSVTLYFCDFCLNSQN